MNSSIECGICVEYLRSDEDLSSTPCGHVFHHRCLRNWFGRAQTCPQCRRYAIGNRIIPLYLNFSPDDMETTRVLEGRIIDLQRTLEMKDAEIGTSRTKNQTLMEKVESQYVYARKCEMEINYLRSEQQRLTGRLQSKSEDAQIVMEWLKVREEKIRHLEDGAKTDKEAYEVEIERQREQQDKLMKELTAKDSALEISERKLNDASEKRENEMEIQRQQDKLIEQLTARCSDLEKSKRKLESELEERVNEITILQKASAIKEEPLSSTELVSEERENEIATVQETRAVKEEPVSLTELESQQQEKKIATVQETRAVKEEPASSTERASKAKRAPRKVLSTIDSNVDTQAERRKRGYLKRPR